MKLTIKKKFSRKNKMKLFSNILLFCFMVVFYSHIALATEIDEKKKEFFEKIIKLEPNNEENRYNYAFELYISKNFQEAQNQVDKLLQINPDSKNGKILKNEIEEIKKLTNQEAIEKRVSEFSFKTLQGSLNDLSGEIKSVETDIKKISSATSDLPKPKEENSKVDFKEKYKTCEYKTVYNRSSEEYKESLLISNYVIKGLNDDAEKLYRQMIEKFPNSPDARLDYVNFLINQKRILDAKKVLLQLQEFYKQNPMLLFMIDEVGILENKKDLELENALNDYRLNFAQFSLAKLQCLVDNK